MLVEFENSQALAAKILREIFRYRRVISQEVQCDGVGCAVCHEPHVAKISASIESGRPILFVLPAFPGKSPNRAKVLGSLPDSAEKLALQFLNNLCERIQKIYSPGARILLCSDGRVFNDVIGIDDDDVTDYQRAISQMIRELNLLRISTFDLDDYGGNDEFATARRRFLSVYSRSIETIRARVRGGQGGDATIVEREALRMYRGMTRFLMEDSWRPDLGKTRSALQRECRVKAYEVMRRSDAWSALIAERFPEGVRLSIHPQGCGSPKIGIQLLAADSWLTPWHGVAVEIGSEFTLMKRCDAERRNARLVFDAEGRPIHFKLEA